jgi:hypothetical protein
VRFSESGEGARGAEGGAKESCGTPGGPLELSARCPSLITLTPPLARTTILSNIYSLGRRQTIDPENERGSKRKSVSFEQKTTRASLNQNSTETVSVVCGVCLKLESDLVRAHREKGQYLQSLEERQTLCEQQQEELERLRAIVAGQPLPATTSNNACTKKENSAAAVGHMPWECLRHSNQTRQHRLFHSMVLCFWKVWQGSRRLGEILLWQPPSVLTEQHPA